MNLQELTKLVPGGESDRLEFKRSTGQRSSAMKTVCAMLNGTGTLNIIDWRTENGNPAPTWQEQAGSVYVTFLPAALPDMQRDTGEVIPTSTRQVPDK